MSQPTLNQVTFVHLTDICDNKVTAVFSGMKKRTCTHVHTHSITTLNVCDCLCSCVRVAKGRRGQGSMSKACILVHWWAGALLTQPMIIQDQLDLEHHHLQLERWSHTNTVTHTNTWLFHRERYKTGQIAVWEVYQGQMGQGSTYTCSKSHNLSTDKSLQCLTRVAPLFSITSTSHTVSMNHWKWILTREVSVIQFSVLLMEGKCTTVKCYFIVFQLHHSVSEKDFDF